MYVFLMCMWVVFCIRVYAFVCVPIPEFDSISDPIMKAKMVALQGINKVMTQGSLSLNPWRSTGTRVQHSF